MSLSAKYQQFLSNPISAALADNASINYVTTLTTIKEPAAIVKHLSAQGKLLKKKSEKVLGVIEGDNGLCLDVETILEFVAGGGAFLPGLDDNFLADRTVTFPVVHIVHFDGQQKIQQIRLYWDQGSLLKQVDVIGARARNWPIRDGKEQARLIASSISSMSQPSSSDSSRPASASRDPNEVTTTGRTQSSSVSSATGDPHGSLSLFQPRDVNRESAFPANIPPREPVKPPSRDLNDILAGDESAPSPSSASRSPSPRKAANGSIAPKAGAGKHFQPNRLFDENDPGQPTKSPEKLKTNPEKYNHFEFGEGEADSQKASLDTKRASKHSRNGSQWEFEDFVTPEKVPVKVRSQDVRQFGWSDDEGDVSPIKRPIVHHARPDAKTNFEFADDGTPPADRKAPGPKGRAHNNGLGLYKDHILGSSSDIEDDTNDTTSHPTKKPLSTATTTVNTQRRAKNFDSQFEINDTSPAATRTSGKPNAAEKKLPEDRKKVLKGLDASWDLYEQSPEQQAKKENLPGGRGIRTGGDGMGGRKDVSRSWGLGDESDEEARRNGNGVKGFVGRRKGQMAAQSEATKGFWDF